VLPAGFPQGAALRSASVSPDLTRRRLLGAAGAAGLALVAGCGGDDETASLDEASSCTVAPETTEGPFYFDADSVRSDIRDDREGVLMRLTLRVQSAPDCSPVRDAVVSIWHCDARGSYSESGERFLRGEQVTDSNGVVEFVTIYPGWYRGRAVHAHLKVFLGGNTAVTSQLFFDEGFTDSVYEVEPYSSTGERDVRIDNDMVYSEADAEGTPLMLTLKRDGDEVAAAGNIVIAS
jgi:protocatechuate 3,4-dioxygenase beta subunit